MAPRSLFTSVQALFCLAAFVQVSSSCSLGRIRCPYPVQTVAPRPHSVQSYAPESYHSKCSCVRKPEEKQEFHVYSGIHSSPHARCKAHIFNVEEPPRKEDEPCVALGYGLQVPLPKREPLRCSSHGYKVEIPPKTKIEHPRNAYGYLITAPRRPPPPKCLSVGYQVETPNVPIPEKSNAYGYAVAVPKRMFQPCVAQSFNYQVEAPPPPPEEEKYAYGIAVQTFPKPPPCLPCVDDYEIPDYPLPPPKPCVPCEDDYVFPKPKLSISISEKSRSSSDYPCKDDESSEYHNASENDESGSVYESRYEQEVHKSYGVTHLRDGGATSYEDESPLPGGYAQQVSDGESAEVGYRGESRVWETSSVTDSRGDRQYEENNVGEDDSYDSGDNGHQVDEQVTYGTTSYDTTPYYKHSPYHRYFSKVVGWGGDSAVAKVSVCGCSSQKDESDNDGYHREISSSNTQVYEPETSYSEGSKEGETYDNQAVDSSLAPVSYDEANGHSPYHTFFSKVVGYGEDSAITKESGCGCSSHKSKSYSDNYHGGFSSGNSQVYLSKTSYSDNENEAGTSYESTAVHSSLPPVSYGGDQSYEDGKESYGFRDENCNSPIQIYGMSSSRKQDSAIVYDKSSTYSDSHLPSGYVQEKYNIPGSCEQGREISVSYSGDSHVGYQYPSSYKSNIYENTGGYEQDNVGSSNEDGITSISSSHYPSYYKHKEYKDASNYEKEKSDSVEYGTTKPYTTAYFPFSHSHHKYDKSMSYVQDGKETNTYSGAQSYSVAEHPTNYYFEKTDDSGNYEENGAESVSYSGVESRNPNYNPTSYNFENTRVYQKDDDMDVSSYVSKTSYSPVKCSACSASHGKYDGGLSYYSVDTASYDGDEEYAPPKYATSPISAPCHGTCAHSSYLPFPFSTCHPRKEYHGVVGHNMYQEIQTDNRLSGTVPHGGNIFKTPDYPTYIHEEDYVKLEDGAKENDIEYYGEKKYYEFPAEKELGKVPCSADESNKVLKNVVVVEEKPCEVKDKTVTIEKIKTFKLNSKGIINEDLTECVPEKETKVIVTKIFSSGEKVGRISSKEYMEGPLETKKIIVEKIFRSSERGSKERESVFTHANSGSYEVVKKVVDEDGNILEKEAAAIVRTNDQDSGRVVVVEGEEGKVAEVIVEGEPKVVYEKEILVKEGDGNGGERVVSKEVIKKIRPAVAVELIVSEPHHLEEVHSYKKLYSSEYKPRGSYESSYVVTNGKSGSYESSSLEKVGSKHSSKEVTEVIKEYVISGEKKDPYQETKVTKVYSSELTGGDDVSKVRAAELEKILTEDPEEAVGYVRPSYGSGEKHKSVFIAHKGSSVEYITKGSISKEKEYEKPEEKVYSVSYETSHSSHTPGTKKTVIVTKKSSTEIITPKYEVDQKSEREDRDEYQEVMEDTTPKHPSGFGNDDENDKTDAVYVQKTYFTENPTTSYNSYEPHKTVIATKKSSIEYVQPKYETEYIDPKYGSERGSREEPRTTKVYIQKQYQSENPETLSYIHKPSGPLTVAKKVATGYEHPEYEIESEKDVVKYITPKEYVEKKVIIEKPDGTYNSYSTSHERVPERESSATYVKVAKSYEDEPEVKKKFTMYKEVSYPEKKPQVKYLSRADDHDNYDTLHHKSNFYKTPEYTSPSQHHHEAKPRGSGEVSFSSQSKPYHFRDLYIQASKEPAMATYPIQHRVFEEGYSPKKSSYDEDLAVYPNGYYKNQYTPSKYSAHDDSTSGYATSKNLGSAAYQQSYLSSSEHRGYDETQDGYLSVPQGVGYLHSRVHSRAEAVKSHNSAYQRVHVKNGEGVKYYSGDDDGNGEQYKSYPSGGAETQSYGDFYPSLGAYGKASSRGSMSNSYAVEGRAASKSTVGESGSVNGYGSGRVKSFVIRQAHGNTKKSSGYHRFEHHVSSSAGGSESRPEGWSPES